MGIKSRDVELNPARGSFDVALELLELSKKLRASDVRNTALANDLHKHKIAAAADQVLLAHGLRLSLAYEALKVENARLRSEAATHVCSSELIDSAAQKLPPAAYDSSGPTKIKRAPG